MSRSRGAEETAKAYLKALPSFLETFALRLEWRVAWQAAVPSPNTALLSSYGGGVGFPPCLCRSWA